MNYWEKRFERLKRQQMGKAETVTAAMRREYMKALTALRKEALDWYYRYAKENEISLADAKRELDARELKAFQLTLKEYIKLAKKKDLPQNISKCWIKLLFAHGWTGARNYILRHRGMLKNWQNRKI